jgi:hypothetical protein
MVPESLEPLKQEMQVAVQEQLAMQGQVKVEGRNFAGSSRKGATVGDVVWRTCCSGRKGQKVVVRYSRCLWASFYKSDNNKKKGNKFYKGVKT